MTGRLRCLVEHVHKKLMKIQKYNITEGSLDVKFPTIWSVGKQRWEESESKKEDAGAGKGRKVAKLCFSNDLWLRRVEK